MGIDATHPDYQTYLEIWAKCRDLIDGQDTVKAKKTKYLPQPSEMDEEVYKNIYLGNAIYYNASGRTAGGYEGMIFRKEPETIVPDSVKGFLKDISLSGTPFNMFARETVRELIDVGRCGVLVDVADESKTNRRPYLSLYATEDILDWDEKNVNGDTVLSFVKLREQVVEPDPDDVWNRKTFQSIRVLTLGPVIEPDLQGIIRNITQDVYRVRVYVLREITKDGKSTSDWVLEKDVIPSFANGDPLTFIPFQIMGAVDDSPAVNKPPLLDLVNMNLSHYLTMAELEYGRFYVAMPQVYVTGIGDDKVKLRRAPNTVWKFSDPQAKVGVVGGEEQSLSALEKADEDKRKMMASLGARLLEDQKREAEAAESLRLRQSGEQASLSTISTSGGYGLQKVLEWLTLWSGASPEQVSVKLNSVFVDEKADPQIMATLFESLQAGKISFPTFYQNLVRFGLAREGVTAEQELKEIDSDIPSQNI